MCELWRHISGVRARGWASAHVSSRDGLAVLLYVLGLSYGAVAIVLSALGIGIGKSSVYRAVQAVAQKVPGMKREKLLDGYRTGALGGDVSSVRCKGKWLPLGLSLEAVSGLTLSLDALPGEEAEERKAWLEPILEAVNADVLVSDDAEAFKKVSAETGRAHQVCKSQVVRNTEALVEELSALIRTGQDRSLELLPVSPEQARADLAKLKLLIHSRQPEEQEQLEQLYQRYANARKPAKGRRFDIAYRMRNLFLDRWNLCPRLTFYRTWKDENSHAKLDGTHNDCERSIGWWVKER